jgi:hypothetical protein
MVQIIANPFDFHYLLPKRKICRKAASVMDIMNTANHLIFLPVKEPREGSPGLFYLAYLDYW